MGKWLLVVETNCVDAAREAKFVDWYSNTHLPDVMETPGFVRAVICERTEPEEGKGKFLAIYEIEADDIDKALKTLGSTMEKKRAEGRMSDLLMRVSRGVYRQVKSLPK